MNLWPTVIAIGTVLGLIAIVALVALFSVGWLLGDCDDLHADDPEDYA